MGFAARVEPEPVEKTTAATAAQRSASLPPRAVSVLSPAARLPLGLKLLVGMQQGSTIVTGGLVTAALVIYSWTVYLDKAIARSVDRLEALQVSTQQVTTANEILKHSMAQQAEKSATGLEPLEPNRAVFVTPAPARTSQPGYGLPEAKNAPALRPLGY